LDGEQQEADYYHEPVVFAESHAEASGGDPLLRPPGRAGRQILRALLTGLI